MTRKIQLDNKKIDLIKQDIERLGLHPTSAIIRRCGVSESVAMGWLRFGEKVRVTLDTETDTDTIDTVTVTLSGKCGGTTHVTVSTVTMLQFVATSPNFTITNASSIKTALTIFVRTDILPVVGKTEGVIDDITGLDS